MSPEDVKLVLNAFQKLFASRDDLYHFLFQVSIYNKHFLLLHTL